MQKDDRITDVLSFWYSDRIKKHWFSSTPELDAEIKQKYEALWEEAANNQLSSWLSSAEGCLALCIVLDQFPLNMFRGEAKAFETEQQSVTITKHAIEQGFDNDIDDSQISFLYMPLMHSEHLGDQDLSVEYFTKRKLDNNARFAKHHRGIVEEFGRFPHRNELLGRESTAEEIEYLHSKRAFTG